jgi:hypothetical protein
MRRILTLYLRLCRTATVLCDALAYVMRMCIRVAARRKPGAFDVPHSHGALITYRVLELAGEWGACPAPQCNVTRRYASHHNDTYPATTDLWNGNATLASGARNSNCIYTWVHSDAPHSATAI